MNDRNPRQLTPEEATTRINKIAQTRARIELSYHCRQRMKERNIEIRDLQNVLYYGRVKEEAEFDGKSEQFKYKVHGATLDDEEAIAITVLLNEISIGIITIF